MTLIKSISGIRGTIGGGAGEGLNPLDIVKFTSAYATLIRKTCKVKSNKIVVGRDARISGEMVKNVWRYYPDSLSQSETVERIKITE